MSRPVPALACLILASISVTVRAQSAASEPASSSAEFAIEGINIERGGLTADETARRALATSSSVREKSAQLAAARARIRQTTIEFFPKLSLRASYTRLSPVESSFGPGALVGAGNPGPLTTGPCPTGGACVLDAAGNPVGASPVDIEFLEDNYAVGANLSVPLSDYVVRLADAAAAASSSRQAAQYALQAEQRKVQTDARVLYYQWLRARAQVYIAGRAVERTRARLADAQAASAVGRLSNADVLRFEAQAASIELARQQAEALRLLTEAQLAILMDDDSGAAYAVGQSVPPVDDSAPIDAAASRRLLSEALATRLELKAIDASARALAHGENAARAGALPRLSAVGEAAYANPNPRYFPPLRAWQETWSVGLVASFDVADPFLSDARGDEIAASGEAARNQRRALRAAIANEVVAAQVEISKARAATAASATLLRAAEESYRVTTDLFQVGRATPTDVLDAESELFGAKLQTTNARIDSVISALQLAHALGREFAPRRR
jgi:outer membrane protein